MRRSRINNRVYLRKCLHCKDKFKPMNDAQVVCSPACAHLFAIRQNARIKQQEKKVQIEKMKTRSDYLRELQTVFNEYIRLRDKDLPCISCGTTKAVQYHAGHYKSVGAYPNMRFNEDNVHKQCGKNCNKELHGNVHEYRKGLILRVGIEKVEALESIGTEPLKHSIPEMIELKAEYKMKIKQLKIKI